MEQNRQLVEQAFNKWRLGQGSILDLMDDNGLVIIPGTAAHCGTSPKKQFIANTATPFMSRFSKPPVPVPSLILSAGDNVVVVANAEGTTLDGKPYRNDYVFVLEFRDGSLLEATEFLDMKAFNVVWDSIAPAPQSKDAVEGSDEALGNR